ncbi:adenosine receptor A3-like [Hydra vulgaris]|uniref:Adenosine receptor A3-like n=1 Tax=Hydra vulgaris TaxID=6087 RepID=A0ABM4DGC0_HYDVU
MNDSSFNAENISRQKYSAECKELRIEFNSVVHIPALILGFLIILANSFVMYLYWKNRTLRKTRGNILLISLSIADLTTGIVVFGHLLPFYYIILADCSTLYYYFKVSYFVSIDILTTSLTITSVLHLLLLSSERFVSLYYALRYTVIITKKRLIVLSLMAWIIGAFVAIIQLSYLIPYIKVPHKNQLKYEFSNKIYTVITIGLFSVIPIFVLLFQYIWMFCLIRRLLKENSRNHLKRFCLRESRGIIVTCIMFVTFILFCFPYLLMKVLYCLTYHAFSKLPSEFFEALFLLRFTISLTNPLIYALYKKDFKETIQKSFSSSSKTILEMESRATLNRNK